MKTKICLYVLMSWLFGLATLSAQAQKSTVQREIDWAAFMAQHDLVWEETPLQWNEGAFTGNGMLGIMAYASLADNRFDFHIGRCDVHEHRQGLGGQRMDIGRMVLRPAGVIQSVSLRQDLWNAELRGTIITDLGEIDFRAVTLRDRMVHMIDTSTTEKHADGSAADFKWEFLPGNPAAPVQQIRRVHWDRYRPNPMPEIKSMKGAHVCVQRLKSGGDYATAWLNKQNEGRHSQLFISTMNKTPQSGVSAPAAVEEIKAAAAIPSEKLIEEHRAWWHAFYPRSFVTIPDGRLESFYWIQLYKIAAGTRVGGPALDLHGPWFRLNVWPQLWLNLNVQLTYWPYLPANHIELAETFINYVDDYWPAIMERYDGEDILGDMIWVLHNYWLHFRHDPDWNALRDRWLPKAAWVLHSFEQHFLESGDDGMLRLKPMGSPEYFFTEDEKIYNTTYNLDLLKWMLATMIQTADTTGGHPRTAYWEEVLSKLPPTHVGEDGWMIGEGKPVDRSQRHNAHLIGVHPLAIYDLRDPAIRERAARTVEHWLTIIDPDGPFSYAGLQDMCGFTLTAASQVMAVTGNGDQALSHLNDLLDNKILTLKTYFHSEILPNTFYVESRGKNPTIETPLSAAFAVLEMLLQSHSGRVEVFPAVPSQWPNLAFDDLRVQGGFLVSARREAGKTRWVSIQSLAGEPLTLTVDGWSGIPTVSGQVSGEIQELIPGDYIINLKKGEQIILFPPGGEVIPAVVAPLARKKETFNPWGVKKGGNLTEHQIFPEYRFDLKRQIPIPKLRP